MTTLRWVVLAGPTASGKSALSLEVAERFGGEIVNADSRQIYRFMDIGTAKPKAEERRRAPHHLFDVAMPDERFDAARYRDLARPTVRAIAARGRLPIVVGGTGFYIRALTSGLFAAPSAFVRLRRSLERLEERVPGTLHRWCCRLDRAVTERIHPNDRMRLIRALEVMLTTGERMSEQQARHGFADRLGTVLYLVVDPGVEELKGRIRRRSADLFERGLVEEVRHLWGRGYGPELPALRSIGYLEAGRVLSGDRSVAEAIEDVVRATERFAKRQRTWFRAEADAVWIHPDEGRAHLLEGIERFLEEPSKAPL
ncbi:MAG TPA: tRNA (adenosine(37)-N6)-dimethylallyltransferase MiaA [Candidatus Binatia bacterium]|nr:tRNA (adenosine(37)-N6)-dimethylallyltransferase MiaA [Candidatus Binatia bacterium]